MADLSYEKLRRLFYYDPETGLFSRLAGKRKVGSLTGNGYFCIKIGPAGSNRRYMAHRLAWFYTYGKWPNHEVDHINGNRLDNRIANLREATRSQNEFAAKKGKGIRWEPKRKKWLARIGVNWKQINLGRYATREEALAAYKKAAKEAFGEFAEFDRKEG